MTFNTVKSKDGTAIAFETAGKGPALILVGGAFCDRSTPASGKPLAALLADGFTVYSYDRRGRGDSGDSGDGPSPASGREAEDLAAILQAAGGSASVFGNSSGGLLALDAAAQGLSIPGIVVYEPPVILDPGRARSLEGLAAELDEAVAGNRRAEAVESFMTKVMQMPAAAVAQMRNSPMWPGLAGLAHTLAYDLLLTAQGPRRLERMPSVRSATLVMDGGASPAWMREANGTLARAIPNARHRTLEGQAHAVDIQTLAREIGGFLAGGPPVTA